MNITTKAILVAMVMISVTKRVGVFTPRPGKNARQNFPLLVQWPQNYIAHNRGEMYCTKSHIHFQVSPSTSEIFNKNLKIGRFYPGLPYHGSPCIHVYCKIQDHTKIFFKIVINFKYCQDASTPSPWFWWLPLPPVKVVNVPFFHQN